MAKTYKDLVTLFLKDEQVRFPILKDHQKGLTDFPMDPADVTLLGSMDSSQLFLPVLAELTQLGPTRLARLLADLQAKKDEVFPPDLLVTQQQMLDAAAAYNSGGIHVFAVSPEVVHVNVDAQIVVRGNGYDSDTTKVQVQFTTANLQPLLPPILSIRADEDLNERITVSVKFPATGDWKVQVRNDPNDPFPTNDNKGKDIVRVIP